MKGKELESVSPYFREIVRTVFEYEEKMAFRKQRAAVEWAHDRGFFYGRIAMYGLNNDNYQDYLSDLAYYRMHPINRFSFWIDDKLTLMHTLREFKQFMPRYFFHITDRGIVLPLLDLPGKWEKLSCSVEDVMKLIEEEGACFLKPLGGTCGEGIHVIRYDQGIYSDNRRVLSRGQLLQVLRGLREYLVEEYVEFSQELFRKMEAVRVVVINPEGVCPEIVCAYAYREDQPAGMEDQDSGWIEATECDLSTGRFLAAKRLFYLHQNMKQLVEEVFMNHEGNGTSRMKPDGGLPHWDMVRENILQICRNIPQLSYMGIDIIVTEDSFKILEINSHQDILWQAFVPALKKDSSTKAFFESRM